MEAAAPVINYVVESVMVIIKKHFGFWASSTKYVEDMNNRMKQLEDTAKDMQEREKRAKLNDRVVPHHVSPWLEDFKTINEKAQSISRAGIGCFSMGKRYKAGKPSCDIKETDDLETRESKIKWSDEKRPLPVPVGDVTQQILHSRDLIFKDALKSLHPDNETQKMIALCGMGGVGKTTMMKQLKNVVEEAKMFDWVVKVVLGESIDPIAFQKVIAEYIGEDLTETSKDTRVDSLRKKFVSMLEDGKKKILVIMDDLWKKVNLEDVGLSPLPKGFKLLFTFRDEFV